MNWIDYTKQKPTDKDAQYLVYYELPHSKGTLASPQIAQWDGKMFYMFDWEDGQTIRFKNAKYWMKIEEPSDGKNSQEFDADYLQSKIDAFTEARRKDGKTGDDILNECRGGSLDLTWEDAKRIVEIADDIIRKACYEHMSEEEYYTEVLRRFKEQ